MPSNPEDREYAADRVLQDVDGPRGPIAISTRAHVGAAESIAYIEMEPDVPPRSRTLVPDMRGPMQLQSVDLRQSIEQRFFLRHARRVQASTLDCCESTRALRLIPRFRISNPFRVVQLAGRATASAALPGRQRLVDSN